MDKRLETFLVLCRVMNYRESSEILHISQPAVTKQIQSLEEEYDVSLFDYDRRKLTRTPASYVLEKYAHTQKYNYEDVKKALQESQVQSLRIGVSKTVGDYLIMDELKTFLKTSNQPLEIKIDNTESLLEYLQESLLDFLIIEGNFNKADYDYRLYGEEMFAGICAKDHPFADKDIPLKDIFSESIIVREKGSGSREIVESELKAFGYEFSNFFREISVNSIQIIRDLVAEKIGISFAYTTIIDKDLRLAHFQVKELTAPHEVHVVALKNTQGLRHAEHFFNTKGSFQDKIDSDSIKEE